MTTQFALDVYLARIKSGYTQSDVAHLLEISRVTISRFERGTSEPSLQDILGLSLIYGRSFESFFADKSAIYLIKTRNWVFALYLPTRCSQSRKEKFLFNFKEGDNFNRMNTLSISRIKI